MAHTVFELGAVGESYQFVTYEIDERVAVITLDRPEKRNAINHAVRVELLHALKRAESDDDVRTILLRGAGPSFSSGYDLTPHEPGTESPNHREGGFVSTKYDRQMQAYLRSLAEFYRYLWDLIKPIVCQIHGWCIGGATELAAFCDLRIAADTTRFGYPIARNISSGDVLFQPWMMGATFAKRWLFTGDEIPADEMFRIGWLTEVVPEIDLAERAMYWAKRIALIDTARIAITKRSINRAFEVQGMWTAIESAQEIMMHAQPESRERFNRDRTEVGLRNALEDRDAPFGDYGASRVT